MPEPCPRELTTQHHLGEGYGHGLVAPEEVVAVAVFGPNSTEFADLRLATTDFSVPDLKNYNLSVARTRHTTEKTFLKCVVEPKIAAGGVYGACACAVGNIRELSFHVEGLRPPRSGKALCVTDRVEPGDHEGHAALGFAEMPDLTPKQIGKVRVNVVRDLIRIFGQVRKAAEVFSLATSASATPSPGSPPTSAS